MGLGSAVMPDPSLRSQAAGSTYWLYHLFELGPPLKTTSCRSSANLDCTIIFMYVLACFSPTLLGLCYD